MKETYSLAESANALGVPLNTLKTHVARGLIATVSVPKGQRMTRHLTAETLAALITRREAEAPPQAPAISYDDAVTAWLRNLESGYQTGKPQSPRTLSANIQGLERYWKRLQCPPSLDKINAESLRAFCATFTVDHEARSCHYAAKALTAKALISLTKYLIEAGLKTEAALAAWLPHCETSATAPVLWSRDGSPMTESGLKRRIQSLRARAKLDITLHGLRRSAVTRWINLWGLTLPEAQLMAGHEDIETTMKYCRTDVQGAIDKLKAVGQVVKAPEAAPVKLARRVPVFGLG